MAPELPLDPLTACLALFLACATPQPKPHPRTPPNLIRLDLHGVVIAPAKADGHPWDGLGTIDDSITVQLAKANQANNPAASVALLMAGPATDGLSKPDIAGTAELLVDGVSAGSFDLPRVQDSFTPQWEHVSWTIAENANARLRLTLYDLDVLERDPVGVLELSLDTLRRIAPEGRVSYLPVGEQTSNQVLLVAASVMPSQRR